MYDILFKNVLIADGTGNPMYRSSVAVKDGKIDKISNELTGSAELILEGDDSMVLAPGFFDVHSHNDLLVAMDPYVTPQVLQGVTFDVSGNCGQSAYPVSKDPVKEEILRKYTGAVMPISAVPNWNKMNSFAEYKAIVDAGKPKINYRNWIGQGTVRIAVMGMENRKATAEELEQMKALVREAMENGAIGISTGLIYAPGVFTPEEEIIELAKVVGEYGGVYATHMRNESNKVVESVEEAIRIAKASGCKLLVSHHKVVGKKNKELYKKTLELMDKARAEGMTVMADQYLFNYGSTTMCAVFPPPYQSDGVAGLLAHLKNPETRAAIAENMENDETWENFFRITGPEGILVVSCPVTSQYNSMHLSEIAEKLGKSAVDTAIDLLLENNGSVLVAIRLSEQEVIDGIWKHPFTAAGSDGIGAGFMDLTHPRAYSAFVKIFQTYVRERNVVTLEDAVRKCTSLPAGFLGIEGKGLVKEGYDADLVFFNKDTIGSDADFVTPRVDPKGVEYVFVNGNIVVENGKIKK